MSARVLLVSAALLGLAACYQTPQSTLAAGETGRIAVGDQPAGGAVVVDAVGMPSTGWVVVHPASGGQVDASKVLGRAYVAAGPSTNVSVPLSAPAAPGQQVAAMLHLDTGNATVFEWGISAPEPLDPPVTVDGAPVMRLVTLR